MSQRGRRWLLVLTAASSALLLLIPLPSGSTPGGGHLLDSGHVLLGGWLALAFLSLLRTPQPAAWWRARWLAGLLATGYLALLEGMQGALAQLDMGGRHASGTDVLADALGAAAFLTAQAAWELPRVAQKARALLAAAAIFAVGTAPAWLWALDRLRLRQEFPQLASFESSLEIERWAAYGASMERDRSWASQGRFSLRVQPGSVAWGGVALVQGPRDWRGHDHLVMDLRVDDQGPLFLHIKVTDADHTSDAYSDRFNRRIELGPGTHVLSIPLVDIEAAPKTRRLNLAEVKMLHVFTQAPCSTRTFWIDHIRLR